MIPVSDRFRLFESDSLDKKRWYGVKIAKAEVVDPNGICISRDPLNLDDDDTTNRSRLLYIK